MSNKSILLIEDDNSLTKMYETLLSVEGYKVDIVNDGAEAIIKLGANKYDLILLDLILPKVNGFDVLKQLRTSGWPSAKDPIVVFSNLGDITDINQARKLGANDYLIKANTSPEKVLEKIKKYIK